jgi:tetratricopeptide (TPR) repeat protein
VALANAWKNQAAQADKNPSAQMQLRDQARQAYQDALKADPAYLPALSGLAHLYVQMDDYERALDTYHRAIQKHPRQASLQHELGMCLARRKDFDQAIVHLQKALELDPESARYTQTLGFTLARAGRIQQSLACLTRVQGKAQAHYNVARMLLHLQQTDEGRQQLTLALEANPQLESARQLLTQLDRTPHGQAVEIQFEGNLQASGSQ